MRESLTIHLDTLSSLQSVIKKGGKSLLDSPLRMKYKYEKLLWIIRWKAVYEESNLNEACMEHSVWLSLKWNFFFLHFFGFGRFKDVQHVFFFSFLLRMLERRLFLLWIHWVTPRSLSHQEWKSQPPLLAAAHLVKRVKTNGLLQLGGDETAITHAARLSDYAG